MTHPLPFEIQAQPDDSACGPTCLHAVYRYFGDSISLAQVVAEVSRLENGGTLAVMLANHALRRGYHATIYAYNLQLFDPTWFAEPGTDLPAKLRAQAEVKPDPKLRAATAAFLEYLRLRGRVTLRDLTPGLIRRALTRGTPVLTGLSATYLYQTMREYGPDDDEDDVRGLPTGHFVVLCGYDPQTRRVHVADPLHPNPLQLGNTYAIAIERVLCAVLLGVLTYDANLLVLRPGGAR
jgi:hypothetical protein